MNRIIEEMMNRIRNKYPEDNYDGLVKLVIYSDGSGHIEETGNFLFAFDSIVELVKHLSLAHRKV